MISPLMRREFEEVRSILTATCSDESVLTVVGEVNVKGLGGERKAREE